MKSFFIYRMPAASLAPGETKGIVGVVDRNFSPKGFFFADGDEIQVLDFKINGISQQDKLFFPIPGAMFGSGFVPDVNFDELKKGDEISISVTNVSKKTIALRSAVKGYAER